MSGWIEAKTSTCALRECIIPEGIFRVRFTTFDVFEILKNRGWGWACVVRWIHKAIDKVIQKRHSNAIREMSRTMDSICRFLRLYSSLDGGKTRNTFANASKPIYKLLILAMIGFIWAIALSGLTYLVVKSLQ
ncbi:hypothetical protein MKK65_03805 [Methylobacterium sp. J-001]|uniref:hypothetical protein n=1 Tax=Methylobacterium sp. J-001 TaxID=2836609 RepID=UPI001FBB9EFD|nr:hypothetical protein [Methylobacterium sp. J-001]MCJ2115725.1 hypothetical protein [Methylobacterium sp. J-001]